MFHDSLDSACACLVGTWWSFQWCHWQDWVCLATSPGVWMWHVLPYLPLAYHLVNIQKTMEHHHFSWVNPLYMAAFCTLTFGVTALFPGAGPLKWLPNIFHWLGENPQMMVGGSYPVSLLRFVTRSQIIVCTGLPCLHGIPNSLSDPHQSSSPADVIFGIDPRSEVGDLSSNFSMHDGHAFPAVPGWCFRCGMGSLGSKSLSAGLGVCDVLFWTI